MQGQEARNGQTPRSALKTNSKKMGANGAQVRFPREFPFWRG